MWSDFFNALGSLGQFAGGIGQVVSPFINLFGNRGGGGGYSAPAQQPGPSYEDWVKQWMSMMAPPEPMEMPDYSEMYSGLFNNMNQMMNQQQQTLSQQQSMMKADQQKALARQAAGARKSLQERGVAYDPLSGDDGAAGSASIAAMLGIPPDELMQALQSYGSDYGFKV